MKSPVDLVKNADLDLVGLMVIVNKITDYAITAPRTTIWGEKVYNTETYAGKEVKGIVSNSICSVFYSTHPLLIKNHNLQNLQEKKILLMRRSLQNLHTFSFTAFTWMRGPPSPFLENFGVSGYYSLGMKLVFFFNFY